MHIWHLAPMFPPQHHGGIVTYLNQLVRQQARHGHHVEVLVPHSPGPATVREQIAPRVHVNWVSVTAPLHGSAALPEIAEHDRQNGSVLAWAGVLRKKIGQPDLIHAHDWFLCRAAAEAAREMGVPLMSTFHYCKAAEKPSGRSRKQQFVVEMQDQLAHASTWITVLSAYMREVLVACHGVSPDRIEVIPPGFTVNRHGVQAARSAVPEILFVGRLAPEKGVPVLVDAMRTVSRRYPQARLVIAGKGPQREEIERQVSACGLSERVLFLGFVPPEQLWRYYTSATLMVVPSTYEPFGMVALEAMAACLPLIVSGVGGLAEIVQHNETGLVVRPGDPDALAAAVIQLLERPKVRRSLATAAFHRLRTVYRWSTSVRQMTDLYARVIGGWCSGREGGADNVAAEVAVCK